MPDPEGLWPLLFSILIVNLALALQFESYRDHLLVGLERDDNFGLAAKD